MIKVTESAIQEVKRLKEKQGAGSQYLRLGVETGGCSGLNYMLKLDDKVGEQDKVYDFDGLKVVVDIRSLLYLMGMTLDYTGELLGGGFKFVNPNAKKSCGCGHSFSA
ncbi:MAG: [Fe-S]-binding protein [candidate division Zixibacteria bacterium RBG_16_48_11]|nr:MAG: [Fe-S]-binding protein [candidate division Zixibacteria bacterium RBG_16_48_11]